MVHPTGEESEDVLKILALGDVVGRPGREAVATMLGGMIETYAADFVVVNGENAAGGSGITPEGAEALFAAGVDCITTGDHCFRQKKIIPMLETDARILRPANYPNQASGKGVTVLEGRGGVRVGVINLLGRVYMKPIDDPFAAVDAALNRLAGDTDIIVVDMHAEATSEKIAMGWYLDGRVTAVLGTHTHVQTADETVLPNGTAYITDLGMTGPHRSVLGRSVEKVVQHLTTGMPTYFDVAADDVRLSGVVVTANPTTHKATAIERIVIHKD